MTRNEAFKAMIDGYMITHTSWNLTNGLCYFEDNEFYYKTRYKTERLNRVMDCKDGYEIYTEKKTEKVTWYKVAYHHKKSDIAWESGELYTSRENFLTIHQATEDCFHWIKLEEVYTHEYEVKNETK
jgi:hypothetical protein